MDIAESLTGSAYIDKRQKIRLANNQVSEPRKRNTFKAR